VSGIGSNYVQTPSGSLSIDFKNSSEFGRLTATGSATLGGHLTGILWTGYAPQAWDSFVILSADEVLQSFASMSLPAIPGRPGLEWNITYDYVNDFVELQVAPIFTADFDEDGDVDGADLTRWKTGFGLATGALHTQGDADVDGDTDGADLLVWQRQLGSHAALPASAGVPEPSAFWLTISTAVLALALRQGRRAGRGGGSLSKDDQQLNKTRQLGGDAGSESGYSPARHPSDGRVARPAGMRGFNKFAVKLREKENCDEY
jgi:hypothetical protein